MCTIIGSMGTLPSSGTVEKARDSMSYRGPDDAGLYYSAEEGVALGHCRLSIIDVSAAGRQPFESNDKRYVLVFNGEIYNYIEIRKELENRYDFKTKTDTEALLAAYCAWGADCLQKLNGMFAFAVWDRKERKLFAARDRFGIKPFYYYQNDKQFFFSSEIKGILALDTVPRVLNKKGFLDYLSYRYVLGQDTLFEHIHALLPGHYMAITEGRSAQQVRYWELPSAVKQHGLGEEEAVAETAALLKDAVRLRMRSDVPIGAYLSGGIDSSLLVALMSELSERAVQTFSIGFPEEAYNELPYAKLVADTFQTNHHEFVISGSDYFSLLPEVIRHKDAPLLSPNEIAWFVLSRELKKDVTVVLGGAGADELFAGYGRILRSGYDYERMASLGHLPEADRSELVQNMQKKYGPWKYSSTRDHFLDQYTYMPLGLKERLLNPKLFDTARHSLLNEPYFREQFEGMQAMHPSDQYLRVFQTTHLLGTLNSLDNMTMPVSVEGRVPFVDHRLVEYVSALPLAYKMTWKSKQAEQKARLLNSTQISEQYDIPKYLLKKIAEPYLPPEIISRKKLGFPVPLDDWFKGSFGDMAKDALFSKDAISAPLYNQKTLSDLLNHKPPIANGNHGMHIWMLVNMELWLRQYRIEIN